MDIPPPKEVTMKPQPRLDRGAYQNLIQQRDTIMLKQACEKLGRADITEIMEQLDRSDATYLFKQIDPKLQPFVFGDVSQVLQNYIIRSISPSDAAKLLDTMPKDERHLFLNRVPRVKLQQILDIMDAEDIAAFKRYSPDTIGHWISDDYFTAYPQWSVNETIAQLKARSFEHDPIHNVYIIDANNILLDKISLNALVIAGYETPLHDIMDYEVATLHEQDSLEAVFDRFEARDAVSMPVVNDAGEMLGVIRSDDIMHLKQEQMTEELQKLGGIATSDTPYMESTIFDQLKKRGGWLAVLFVGEMLTATVMSSFEDELDKAVVLALFLPLILSSGGNSGSQSSTLIIRALALKEFDLRDWPKIFKRELITGVLLGLFLGFIGLVRIAFWQQLGFADYSEHGLYSVVDVSIAVTAGIIGIVSWGNLVGSLLPIGLRSLKLDPATISAPFLATFVDVTGLIIYFSLASVLLHLG
jgi:magnesium transporter